MSGLTYGISVAGASRYLQTQSANPLEIHATTALSIQAIGSYCFYSSDNNVLSPVQDAQGLHKN